LPLKDLMMRQRSDAAFDVYILDGVPPD
jgi:hypothetical protein